MYCRNVENLIKRVDTEDIYLVTADGSIDCMYEPEEHENRVTRLHWCEAIADLTILNNGDNLVLLRLCFE